MRNMLLKIRIRLMSLKAAFVVGRMSYEMRNTPNAFINAMLEIAQDESPLARNLLWFKSLEENAEYTRTAREHGKITIEFYHKDF
jgi:hypothetical protein